jgi:hypothetical protein
MQQITVEPAFGQTLDQLSGQAVLCDAEGRALGFFSPLPARPLVEDLQLEPPLSIAQTDELRKDRTGKPLSAILGRLGIE